MRQKSPKVPATQRTVRGGKKSLHRTGRNRSLRCLVAPMIRKSKLKGLRNLHSFIYGGTRVFAASVYQSSPNAHLEGRKNRSIAGRLISSRGKTEREGEKIGEIEITETGHVARNYSDTD